MQLISDEDFPIKQYADDTLVIMEADARQLFCLKGLLNTYAESTKVNYNKSFLVPINVQEDKVSKNFWMSSWNTAIHILGAPFGNNKVTCKGFLTIG